MELKTLEQKGAYDDLFGYGEKVVRHVRTPAGVARFKQPIGSVIVGKGRKLDAIKEIDSEYIGWNKYKGKDRREYYVGKEKGKYVVTTPKDEDLSSHDKEEEALDWLNKHAGGSSEPTSSTKPASSGTSRAKASTSKAPASKKHSVEVKPWANDPNTSDIKVDNQGETVAVVKKTKTGHALLPPDGKGNGPVFNSHSQAIDHVKEWGTHALNVDPTGRVTAVTEENLPRKGDVVKHKGAVYTVSKVSKRGGKPAITIRNQNEQYTAYPLGRPAGHAAGTEGSEGAMHIAPTYNRTKRKSAWDGLDIQHKSVNAVQTTLINKVNNAMEQKDNATARRYATLLRNDARSNGMRDGGLVDVEKFIEGIG